MVVREVASATGPGATILADAYVGSLLGKYRIERALGQAVVVANDFVLAVEAAEGTDRMLARVADLRRERRVPLTGKVGVLVKGPKPHQDRRLDFPSIGAETIRAAAAAGLAGVAVEARGAITADLAAFITAADAAGLFVVGVATEAIRGPA